MKNTIDVHEKAQTLYTDVTDSYRSYHQARKMFRQALRSRALTLGYDGYQDIIDSPTNKGLFVDDNS